jgi:hypothetical protein
VIRRAAAVVFVGPSLPRGRLALPDFVELRPPAAAGDLARAAAAGAAAIGLVDGVFETTASPWPREILWALSRGVAVYGSSSLGALRAVELAPWGMIGVGRVFADYRDGRLEDDDEVALLHGPREAGYPKLSEAMVNIRATLARARATGLVAAVAHDRLVALAKAEFYKDRTWERLLDRAARAGLPRAPLHRLAAWLPDGAVDVKAADARRLLARIARRDAPRPAPAAFRVPRTRHWVEFRARHAPRRGRPPGSEPGAGSRSGP